MMDSITRHKALRAALALAFWGAVWQLASMAVGQELLLPGPLDTLKTLGTLVVTPEFWRTAFWSLARIFGGTVAGVALGVLLAGACAALPVVDMLVSPMVRLVRATPVASFIVLLVLWAKTGRVPAIIAALMVLPVVWGNVLQGLRETDRQLLEMASAYRMGRWRTLRLVIVPSVAPYFVSACMTALGLAWKSGVAAEVLCHPDAAIGTQLYFSKLYLETPTLFAWTAVVIVLSLLLEWGLGRLLRRLPGQLKGVAR